MNVKPVSVEKLYSLRNEVLRPGKPIESTYYENDKDDTTIHLALYHQKQIRSIATFYPQEFFSVESKNAYRLRGMATDPRFRRRGLGFKLMSVSFEILKDNCCDVVWCKARIVAIPFYESLGFVTVGDEYTIRDIGPHYTMFKFI